MIYIQEYISKIKKGEIIVCQDILDLIKLIEEQYIPNYYFNEEKANIKIKFIENYCKHYKGKFGGKPLILSLWQKFIISVIFGFENEDGTRVIREALICVARKNGKTTFLAALQLAMLIADKENGPECYCIATKKEQARELYNDAYRMAQMSPTLNNVIHKRKSDLECLKNFGSLKPLASDSNSLDGLNPSFAVGDEFHAWKDFNLYDVITSAFGARHQPLFILISTFGTVRGLVFDQMISLYEKILKQDEVDHTRIAFIFRQDSVEELSDEKTWIKSNPNLNISVSLEYLRNQLKRAIQNPAEKIGVYTKNFNIPQNPNQVFFTKYECEIEGFDEDIFFNQPIFVGIDHAFTRSAGADFTCIKFGVVNPINDDRFIKTIYLMPEKFVDENQVEIESVAAKSKEDKINYQLFVDNGDLKLIKGFQVTYQNIIDEINQFVDTYKCSIRKIGADPSNLSELISFFNAITGDNKFVISVLAQKTMWNTPRIERIKASRSAHKTYCNNKMDIIQFANTIARYDKHNYILIDTLEKRKHNDGPFAEICIESAIDTYMNAVNNGIRNVDVMKQSYVELSIDYDIYKNKRKEQNETI